MPVHLRWELYPVPHEPTVKYLHGGSYMEDSDWWLKNRKINKLGNLLVMLPEIFFMKGVAEGNKVLWFWSLMLHWGLYLFVGAAGFILFDTLIRRSGLDSAIPGLVRFDINLQKFIVLVAWLSGIIGVIGATGILVLRLFSKKLKNFSSFGTIFNLVLLLALFASEVAVCFTGVGSYHQLQDFLRSLISFQTPTPLPTVFSIYLILLSFFLIYFPFTHMTHMYLKYFTYHSVRWDDQPLEKGGRRERSIGKSMAYPVSWSAPHIRGDGKKTWVDVVSEDGTKK